MIRVLIALVALLGHQPGFAEDQDIEQLRQAAEDGDARAQYELGWKYHWGRGVPENTVEAMKWYRKAAEQGYAEAQNQLGEMYYFGWGVPENPREVAQGA